MLKYALMAVFLLSMVACGGEPDTPEPAAPQLSVLEGAVTYRERMALRMDAVITVRLQDISLADAPALLLAETTFSAQGKSVPIPYVLEYDPARIQENRRYAVRAEIRGGDQSLMWTTDTVHPVLTQGAPSTGVEIMLVRSPR